MTKDIFAPIGAFWSDFQQGMQTNEGKALLLICTALTLNTAMLYGGLDVAIAFLIKSALR